VPLRDSALSVARFERAEIYTSCMNKAGRQTGAGQGV